MPEQYRTEQYQTLSPDYGSPRANANGVFIAAVIIIVVFAVITYSCSRKQKTSTMFEPPSQPLSRNEWFVGKAQGISSPQPSATPVSASTPLPLVIPALSSPPKSPIKALGGKLFNASSTQATAQADKPRDPKAEAMEQWAIQQFGPEARNDYSSSTRPEYYQERSVEAPVSDFEVKAGTTLPAQLDMAINSDLGGPAVAHITRAVYDTVTGRFELIPPGAKLYGTIDPKVTAGQNRVDVIWKRIIFPNGASLVIDNMRASDSSGQLGLHHTVDNHMVELFGGAALLSAISGALQLSQPQQSASWGQAPSAGQTLAAALGQNLGQVSTEFIHRQMQIKPTIVVPNGEYFTVIVTKDMVFPGPYGKWE